MVTTKYRMFKPLTEAELGILKRLATEVRFKNSFASRCRMGTNKATVQSVYEYSKWFDWKAAQRRDFKQGFPDHVVDMCLQGWFLKIPPKDGFLDEMNYWVGLENTGEIFATALQDQQFIIGHEVLDLKAGDQVGFSLSTLHEIKPSPEGQLWACMMTQVKHDAIVEL